MTHSKCKLDMDVAVSENIPPFIHLMSSILPPPTEGLLRRHPCGDQLVADQLAGRNGVAGGTGRTEGERAELSGHVDRPG